MAVGGNGKSNRELGRNSAAVLGFALGPEVFFYVGSILEEALAGRVFEDVGGWAPRSLVGWLVSRGIMRISLLAGFGIGHGWPVRRYGG